MKARNILLLAAVLFLCCSCAGGFKDIRITSCEVKSLNPTGFSKMEAVLKIGISNPAPELHLSELQGVVKFDNEPCLTLATPDIVIEGRKDEVYMVTLTGKINRGFDLLKIVSIARDPSSLESATLDIDCRASLGSGLGKKIAKRDIPLKDLIGKL